MRQTAAAAFWGGTGRVALALQALRDPKLEIPSVLRPTPSASTLVRGLRIEPSTTVCGRGMVMAFRTLSATAATSMAGSLDRIVWNAAWTSESSKTSSSTRTLRHLRRCRGLEAFLAHVEDPPVTQYVQGDECVALSSSWTEISGICRVDGWDLRLPSEHRMGEGAADRDCDQHPRSCTGPAIRQAERRCPCRLQHPSDMSPISRPAHKCRQNCTLRGQNCTPLGVA